MGMKLNLAMCLFIGLLTQACYSQPLIEGKLKVMPFLGEENIQNNQPKNFSTSGPAFRNSNGRLITIGHLRAALEPYIQANNPDYNELYSGLSDPRPYIREGCNIVLQEFTKTRTRFNCYTSPNSVEHAAMLKEWKEMIDQLH
jgi:hypothetical protein